MSAAKRKDFTFLAFEASLVAVLVTAGLSQRAALGLLGISRGSWQYRTRPRPPVPDPVPRTARRSASWLDPGEIETIREKVREGFAAGASVYQSYYRALDARDPVASQSSWYRVAAAYLASLRPVRPRRKRRAAAMPQWDATAPMQVWCWDITKLKTAYRNQWFELYVVIDAFSRMIVGWRVERRESAELAQEMFQAALARHGGSPRVVHSDGGSSMTSLTLTSLFKELGIETSKNRPRVSNDNPHAESLFKTAKYSPGTPAWFTDLEHARAWAAAFVEHYNHHHAHSALEGHTPANVHDGTWLQVHHQRQATLDALHHKHPDRYPCPTPLNPPYAHVTLNTPKNETTQDRLKTG
jgi:transposase InsO family protein